MDLMDPCTNTCSKSGRRKWGREEGERGKGRAAGARRGKATRPVYSCGIWRRGSSLRLFGLRLPVSEPRPKGQLEPCRRRQMSRRRLHRSRCMRQNATRRASGRTRPVRVACATRRLLALHAAAAGAQTSRPGSTTLQDHSHGTRRRWSAHSFALSSPPLPLPC